MPAGDVDVFDDEAEQGLSLVEVEGVDHGQDAAGEVADAPAELVVSGEFLALRGDRGVPVTEAVAVAGILVLAATGPTGSRLREPERHGLIGALVIIAAASLGDVILLATAAHLVQAAAQTVVAVAFTASTARLAAGATAMTHCVRSHRSITSAG